MSSYDKTLLLEVMDKINAVVAEDNIEKALTFSNLSDININTSDYAQSDYASKGSTWKERVRDYFRGFTQGEVPRELGLNNGYVLSATQIDTGIFNGVIRDMNGSSASYGDVVHKVVKLPLADLIIDLKVRGYIDDLTVNQESDSESNMAQTIINIIHKAAI